MLWLTMIIISANDFDSDIVTMAKYAINYMTGLCLFDDDGNFNAATTKQSLHIHVNDMDMYVKPAIGSFIVDIDTFPEFESKMMNAIETLEKEYLAGTKHEKYLNKYHSVFNNIYTTVKVKPMMTINGESHVKNKSNKRIQFTRDDDVVARFVWKIVKPSEFAFEIKKYERNNAIAQHIVSIMYDGGFTNHPSKTTLQTFRLIDVDAYRRVVIDLSIVPVVAGNHLYYELNGDSMQHCSIYTLANVPFAQSDMYSNSRDIITYSNFNNKIITRALINTDGKSITFNEDGDTYNIIPLITRAKHRYNSCKICKSDLYEDCYAIVDSLNRTMSLVCAACMHYGGYAKMYNNNRIHIVDSGVTIHEHIDKVTKNKNRRDVLHDIADNGVHIDEEMVASGFMLLGKKYVGVKNFQHFIFSKYSKDYVDRKIVMIPDKLRLDMFLYQQNGLPDNNDD